MKILKSNHLSKLVVAILAAASTPIASADYTAAGTDYASLTLQKWTEDSANDLISMVDSFACIIKNTRGDLEPHANGSWRALIDEVACGLAERDNQSGKKYAKVTSTSSRASNTANHKSYRTSNLRRVVATLRTLLCVRTRRRCHPSDPGTFRFITTDSVEMAHRMRSI